MKKNRWIKWGVFLLVGVICTIVHSCKAKAAAFTPEPTPDPADGWQPPAWITTEDPFDTAAPLWTPAPLPSWVPEGTPEPERALSADDKKAQVNYTIGYFQNYQSAVLYQYNGTTNTGGGSIVFQKNPWFTYPANGNSLSNGNYVRIDRDGSLNYTTQVFTKTNFKGGIALEIRYTPLNPWTNDITLRYKLSMPLSVDLSLDPNAPITLEQFEFSNDNVLIQIPVKILFQVYASDGHYYWVEFDTNASDITSYICEFDLDFLDDDVYVSYLNVSVVVNYDYEANPLYSRVADFYASDAGSQLSPQSYPFMQFTGLSTFTTNLTPRYTDAAKNRNAIVKALQWLFVPDGETLSNLINNYVADPSEGGSSLPLTIREMLYGIFDNTVPQAILHMPAISFPMGDQTITISNGYVFNLSSFYDGSTRPNPWTTLISGVRYATSILMFSAFFQSLWAIVVQILGLHLWQGVSGEDLDEADSEEG